MCPFSHALSSLKTGKSLILSHRTCCFSSRILVPNWPTSRGRWYIFEEFCGDGAMWVSVLVLEAAEHPVPLLSGPQYPCRSVAASSLIKWSLWHSLPSVRREGDDVRTCCRPRVHTNLKCMNNEICEWKILDLGENPPVTQWSQRPWLILVPVVPCFELVALPTTNQLQCSAGLFFFFYLSASQRLWLPEELSLLTCKGSESLIFKYTLACDWLNYLM